MQPSSQRLVEPLLGQKRYKKVQKSCWFKATVDNALCSLCDAQIRDLNRGTFGFVQLALDTLTGTQVAIKFIERGEKVSDHLVWHNEKPYEKGVA